MGEVMKKNININFIVKTAIIAALYAALTWLFAPISYDAIQFRISEVLVLIVLFNPKYAFAIVLGCFIANTTSTLGWPDMVFGTLATALAVIPMIFVRKIFISAAFPVISNMFIVPLELGIAFGNEMFAPAAFWYNVATVGLGEFVVLYFIGIPLMLSISKNEGLTELLEFDTTNLRFKNKYLTFANMLVFALAAVGVVLYCAYPMFQTVNGTETINNSSFVATCANHQFYMIGLVTSAVLYLIGFFFVKNRNVKLGIIIFCMLANTTLAIVLGLNINECFKYVYYYLYFIYVVLLIVPFIFDKTKEINEEELEIMDESEI